MVQIRVEPNSDGRGVRLRLRNFGRKLDDPALVIQYIATQRTLGRTGWSNSKELIDVAQELEAQDLVLRIPPRLANHIDPGTGLQIELPELGVNFQHAWMLEGQGPGIDVEVKGLSQPITREALAPPMTSQLPRPTEAPSA